MRIHSILYYTTDKVKYKCFETKIRSSVDSAIYKGTAVCLIDPFRRNGAGKIVSSRFCDIRALTIFLSTYSGNLSDLVILIDDKQINNGTIAKLREIIVEYPEVKFLFDVNISELRSLLFDLSSSDGNMLKLASNETQGLSVEDCEYYITLFSQLIRNKDLFTDFCVQIQNHYQEGESDEGADINNASAAFDAQQFSDSKVSYNNRRNNLLSFFINRMPGKNKGEIIKNMEMLKEKTRKLLVEYIALFLKKKALFYVHFEHHIFPPEDNDFILKIVHWQDNLFDASNLRYAIKQWKYADLSVEERNFSSQQESRRDFLALCVEEERGQNRFNSYCLFTMGYRVMPITSADELQKINSAQDTRPSIIIRDYDLQFFDADRIHYGVSPSEAIKAIRGFRDKDDGSWETNVFDSPCWSSFYNNGESDGQVLFHENQVPIYYITKGTSTVKVASPKKFSVLKVHNCRINKLRYMHYFKKHRNIFRRQSSTELHVPGLKKPIDGIIHPFMQIPEIKMRFAASRKNNKYFNTSRLGHSHGVPLDIYTVVTSIIKRAQKYYENGKYIHAAILSNEAMEYLNGFHQALMIEAYYINAISENAIAMDAMVRDDLLKQDAELRIKKIQEDVERIYQKKGATKSETKKMAINTLNQIYSDCRNFCRDKEHFESESSFIGAMAHLNEGGFLNKL